MSQPILGYEARATALSSLLVFWGEWKRSRASIAILPNCSNSEDDVVLAKRHKSGIDISDVNRVRPHWRGCRPPNDFVSINIWAIVLRPLQKTIVTQ